MCSQDASIDYKTLVTIKRLVMEYYIFVLSNIFEFTLFFYGQV